MDGEENSEVTVKTEKKPRFSWAMLGRERKKGSIHEFDPEKFESFRAIAISLPLIKMGETTPEDWASHFKKMEDTGNNLDILDAGFQKPEYVPDSLRIMESLTEFLLFNDGKKMSNKLAEVYSKNFDKIAAAAEVGDDKQRLTVLRIAARFAIWKGRVGRILDQRDIELLQKNAGKLEEGFELGMKSAATATLPDYIEPMVALMEFGNKTMSTIAHDALMRSLNNGYYNPNRLDPDFRFGFAAEVIKNGLWDKKLKRINEMAADALNRYGFDFEDWKKEKIGKKRNNPMIFGYVFAEKNGESLVHMGWMEKQRPSITNFYVEAMKDKKYEHLVSEEAMIKSFDLAVRGKDIHEDSMLRLTGLLGISNEKAWEYVRTWTQESTINVLEAMENIEKNLQAIKNLEAEIPGITGVLNDEFNIFHFARYPKEMMLEQFRQKDNRDIPYGIIVSPFHDHNGAFYEKVKMYEDFLKDLGGKRAVRVIEVRTVSELIRGLIKLNKRYWVDKDGTRGPGQKIEFAVVNGHGQKDGIQFGRSEYDGMMFQTYLLGRGGTKVKDFFVPNPTLVLQSCSTGVKRGIGQILSEILAAHVIAPKKDTSMSKLEAKYDEADKLSINAEYADQKVKNQFHQGVIEN